MSQNQRLIFCSVLNNTSKKVIRDIEVFRILHNYCKKSIRFIINKNKKTYHLCNKRKKYTLVYEI